MSLLSLRSACHKPAQFISFPENARFKKIYEQWKQFRAEGVLWFCVVENTLDNFMARQSAANKL